LTFRRICRCAVAFSALLLAFPSTGLARDGVGGVDIDNDRVTAGSTANTIAFTYTADDASFRGRMRFVVPSGWTRPQAASPTRSGYVKVGRRGCAGPTRLSGIQGRTLTINAVCAKGRSLRITYSNATAPQMAADGYTFLTQTRANPRKGTPTPRFLPLAPEKQPVVAVIGAAVDNYQVTTTSLAVAGTPFSLTVRPVDVYGNTARDASGAYYANTMSFTSTDAAATLPPPYAVVPGDFGTHTFRGLVLNTPGLQTIRVSDQNGITGESLPITVSSYR
jgi:hypothetical protein